MYAGFSTWDTNKSTDYKTEPSSKLILLLESGYLEISVICQIGGDGDLLLTCWHVKITT